MGKPEEIANRLGISIADLKLVEQLAPSMATELVAATVAFATGDEYDSRIDIADIARRVVRDIKKTGDQFQDNIEKWMPNKNATVIGGISTWTINNRKEDF